MTQSLCLHLGDCKTGSTSIQTVLKNGAWRSPETSVLYPVEETRLHHCLLAATLYKAPQKKNRALRWGRLQEAVRASPADLAVVSGEWFEFADPREVDRALREYLPEHADQVRLIAYLRPHADKIVSSFQEQTKLGEPHDSLADFFAASRRGGRHRYAPRLRAWREVFGDRYEVRPMIRDRLRDGDVVRDFLDWALQGADFEVEGQPSSNTSLSLRDLALLREMHRRRRLPPNVGRRMADALHAEPSEGAEPLRMDKGLLAEVRREYLDDAREIDAEFFEGAPFEQAFDRAEAKAVDRPQSLAAEDHFDAEELRRIAAFAGFSRILAKQAGMKVAPEKRRKRAGSGPGGGAASGSAAGDAPGGGARDGAGGGPGGGPASRGRAALSRLRGAAARG